jgi:hypothetical protein
MTDTEPAVTESQLAELRSKLEEVFTTYELRDAKDLLLSAEAASLGHARIVVVGQIGKGKTSLINAVLGRPGLLPVPLPEHDGHATRSATRCYVGVGAASDGHEEVRVHLSDGSCAIDAPAALHYWLSANADGSDAVAHADVPLGTATVKHVEVLLDDPLLNRMTLFDTPGVGGLDAAADAVTLEALRDATALVFVCSALEPISIAEREFLVEAARRIDQIVFVMTNIDQLADHGVANAEENQDKILGSRLEPDRSSNLTFLRFSAKWAAKDKKRPESGVIALREQLERIAAAHAAYRALNSLRLMRSAISEANAVSKERRDAIVALPDTAGLEQLNAVLVELNQTSQTWRSRLSRQFERAGDDVFQKHRTRMTKLRKVYEERIARRQKTQEVQDDLLRELKEVQEKAYADIGKVVMEEVAQELRLPVPVVDALAEREKEVSLPDEDLVDYLAGEPVTHTDIATEAVSVLTTTYMGDNMARTVLTMICQSGGAAGSAAAASGPYAPIVAPVAAILAIGWAALQLKLRKRSADHAALRTWALQTISDAGQELHADINRVFKRACWRVEDAIEAAIGEAKTQTVDEQTRLRTGNNDVDGKLDRLKKLDKELDPLLTQLKSLRSTLIGGVRALTAVPDTVEPAAAQLKTEPLPQNA